MTTLPPAAAQALQSAINTAYQQATTALKRAQYVARLRTAATAKAAQWGCHNTAARLAECTANRCKYCAHCPAGLCAQAQRYDTARILSAHRDVDYRLCTAPVPGPHLEHACLPFLAYNCCGVLYVVVQYCRGRTDAGRRRTTPRANAFCSGGRAWDIARLHKSPARYPQSCPAHAAYSHSRVALWRRCQYHMVREQCSVSTGTVARQARFAQRQKARFFSKRISLCRNCASSDRC